MVAETVDLGYAQVDIARQTRQGLPEVIYGPGKSADQITGIAAVLLTANTGPVLATRIGPEIAEHIPAARYDPAARLLTWRRAEPGEVSVCVVSAGTADAPVAAEAAAVASAIGLAVTTVTDVGVAGIHRLLAHTDAIRAADVVIVVAGMEGALASAVGGLAAGPVIAVPTSTGYGAALEGVTALLAMLSSCTAGVTVVNIDSGFSAAMAAFRLAQRLNRHQ